MSKWTTFIWAWVIALSVWAMSPDSTNRITIPLELSIDSKDVIWEIHNTVSQVEQTLDLINPVVLISKDLKEEKEIVTESTIFDSLNDQFKNVDCSISVEKCNSNHQDQIEMIYNLLIEQSKGFNIYIQSAKIPDYIQKSEKNAWIINGYAKQFGYIFTFHWYARLGAFNKISETREIDISDNEVLNELFGGYNQEKMNLLVVESEKFQWITMFDTPVIEMGVANNEVIYMNEVLHAMMTRKWYNFESDIRYRTHAQVGKYNATYMQYEEYLSNTVSIHTAHKSWNIWKMGLFSEDLKYWMIYNLADTFWEEWYELTSWNYWLNRAMAFDLFRKHASKDQIISYESKINEVLHMKEVFKTYTPNDFAIHLEAIQNGDEYRRSSLVKRLEETQGTDDYEFEIRGILMDLLIKDTLMEEMVDNFLSTLSEDKKNQIVKDYMDYWKQIISEFKRKNTEINSRLENI